jgi:photosystem II stability/assembly factor-like uncharacterized protein
MLSGISNFVSAQVGQSGWTFVNPYQFSFSCIASAFRDNNTGLMVGTGGGIARTTDGGVTWQHFGYHAIQGPDLIKPNFNKVQFASNSVAYTVGTQGVMLKSIDGGINWSRVPNPFEMATNLFSANIQALYFLNENLGYIGGDTIPGIAGHAMYKTTDGGATWNKVAGLPKGPSSSRSGNGTSIPFFYDSTRAKNIFDIKFLREDLGYATGQNGMIWKYNGTKWINYSITNFGLGLDTVQSGQYRPNTGPQVQNYSALSIISDSVIITVSFNNGILVRCNTQDETTNENLDGNPVLELLQWSSNSAFPNGIPSSNHNHLVKSDDGKLLLPGGSPAFGGVPNYYISSDTGRTWQRSDVYAEGEIKASVGFTAIALSPGGRVVLGGFSGVTADSLAGTWNKPYKNPHINSSFTRIKFADKDNGAIAGFGGTLAVTKDGGATWNDLSNLNDRSGNIAYNSLGYPTKDAMYLAVTGGEIKGSGDQGETFDKLFVDAAKFETGNSPTPSILAMYWLDAQKGWAASYRGHQPASGVTNPNLSYTVIFFTKDGGLTWDSSKSLPAGPWPVIGTAKQNYAPQIRDMAFANERVGYAVGNRASIWKTMDGGVNWARVYQGNDSATFTGTYLKVALVDSNVAWVVGNGGQMFRTLDGGATWQNGRGDFPLTANVNSIAAYDTSQVFVVTNSGMVWFTRNGGGNWQSYSAPVRLGGGSGIFEDLAFTSIDPGCGQEVCNTLWVVGSSQGNILRFGSDKVLPIKFSSLTGSAVSNGNQLFWTAFEQTDVKHFEVEGSRDGRKFETIEGRIYPTGFSQYSYNYLHKDAPKGTYFYRVKAVEKSGSIFYTNVISLDNKNVSGWKYQVVSNSIILNNASALRGNVTVQVVNGSGQIIAAKNWKQPGGAFNDLLNLPHNAHGIYYIRVLNEGTAQTFKVLIP